jgi:rod shape-determining protein MreD
MGLIIGIPLMAGLAIMQSAIISYMPFLEGTPNMVLLVVVSWSLIGRSREAMILGLFGGVFLDMLSILPVGSTSISLILIAYLISLLEGGFWESNFFTPLVATLVATVMFFSLTILTLLLAGRTLDLLSSLTRIFLPSLFLNLVICLPIYHLTGWIANFVAPPKATT